MTVALREAEAPADGGLEKISSSPDADRVFLCFAREETT